MILCKVIGICAALTGVPQVHDGDTLYIQNESVRLYGIDAEELNEPNGYAARDALRALVSGRAITCRPTGQFSHNRVVARCYLGSIEINRELVARGVVLDCFRYSRGEYRTIEPSDARARLLQKPYC